MKTEPNDRKTIWEQMVDQQAKWIGGTLVDDGDSMDRRLGMVPDGGMVTTITGMEFKPCGDNAMMFSVIGADFTCGFNTQYGGIDGSRCVDGRMAFSGYGGHTWYIKEPERQGVDTPKFPQHTCPRGETGECAYAPSGIGLSVAALAKTISTQASPDTLKSPSTTSA